MTVYTGVWPALVTPSSTDQSINIPVLKKLVSYLIDKGVEGFYVGGTTGEGIFMPVADRKALVEAVQAENNGRVPIIVHAGAVAAGDAVDLARHARDHGAVGISSILPPLYNSSDSLQAYFERLAGAVPDIAFMPYLLNPTINTVDLLKRLLHIPNLAGTKYTGPNLYEFRALIDMGSADWTMFSGMDEQAVYALMMGATGNVGSTLNFMPGVYKAMQTAVSAGRFAEAQELQIKANRVTTAMIAVGFNGALKEVLSTILGESCGDPRLPGLPLSDAARRTLHESLAQTDFDALVAM
ncbi:MAG TPA: dihydrodipicolinate synthase family protein [Aggregatilineales bacterium]|jgi:N-acetylneuraminate lyase|nr:dihydrodipicolinate synthase family protein [Aggregatilineales bacterium]